MSNAARYTLDNWACDVGKFVTALQGLEFILRAFLHDRYQPATQRLPASEDIYAKRVGEDVLLNPMTDYRTLAELIKKYNTRVLGTACPEQVDDSVVTLRDALAHGRVSMVHPNADVQLVKFTKPRDSSSTHVQLSFTAALTRKWIHEQIATVQAQTQKVSEAQKRVPK